MTATAWEVFRSLELVVNTRIFVTIRVLLTAIPYCGNARER